MATQIEPELIRATRLIVLPHLEVDVESELWFSDLVQTRSPNAIVLQPAVITVLRRRLAQQIADIQSGHLWQQKSRQKAEPAPASMQIWTILERVHSNISPALLLEEQITWISLTDPNGASRSSKMLEPALRALIDGQVGIADWFSSAWQRLPETVKSTRTAWQIAQVTASVLPGSAALRSGPVPSGLGVADASALIQSLEDVPLGVRREGTELVFGDPAERLAIPVPNTNPRLLELVYDASNSQSVKIPVDEITRIQAGSGPVRLKNARGAVFDIADIKQVAPTATRAGSGRLLSPFGTFARGLGNAIASRVSTAAESAGRLASVSNFVGRSRSRALLVPAVQRPEPWVVDRPAEVDQIVAALRRSAGTVGITTAVHGAGGFGKTTVAKMVRADRRVLRRFRGRVYWVTLGRDVGKQALAGLVNGLIGQVEPGRAVTFTDARQAAEQLAAVLAAGPRRLVVLDDVWSEEQLAAFPVAGRCARLVTTRIPSLAAGASVPVKVDQMSETQARALLSAGLPPLPAAVAAGLLEETGRWPLLLRLVNKILADQAQLQPDIAAAAEDLLGRLRRGGALQVDQLTGAAGQQLDVSDPDQRQRGGPGHDPGQHQPAERGRA